ncbi:MICOS complex subunit MIC27 [Nematolebias whitei]|uniref:MICOS complex subunit MIC27 n=1 Tax=Nematolebias whitei TaxID=451745 RepID=UPI00189BFE92|nr:MICOS complex subunit MIC27 [Nematolebias whitei]
MAAKVALVAVPAVLGLASVRVYTVSEAPPGGLVSRDGLNIYAPLPEAARAPFLPESPGVVERGLTTAREGVLPLLQAVKGACVSVKRGSFNLYHAGEDAYYYLLDPPPGFLPRFGTITMAGLLGMFLARRGSRFKRFVVPLSLMSAGASVCYPAQAVAVLKVTGKNVYAAGQWSHATASSLLSTMKATAKQTQSTAASSPGSSAQSFTVPENQGESAESVSDEMFVGVTAEEESASLTEISAIQASTETGSGSFGESIPVQAEDPSLSKEVVSVGTKEGSDRKQAADDGSDTRTAEHMSDLELETVPGPVVESAEPAAELESAPAVGATPTLTPTPLPQQPTAENSNESSAFKPDPALLDFGQSSPEDEDLYSTRS